MTTSYSVQLPLSLLPSCIKKNKLNKIGEETQNLLSSFSSIYPAHTLCYNLQMGLLSYLLL